MQKLIKEQSEQDVGLQFRIREACLYNNSCSFGDQNKQQRTPECTICFSNQPDTHELFF